MHMCVVLYVGVVRMFGELGKVRSGWFSQYVNIYEIGDFRRVQTIVQKF